MADRLVLQIGDARDFQIQILDDDIKAATDATFVMSESWGSAALLTRTTNGTPTLSLSGSTLTATLSQGEADALTEGVFVAEVAIKIGGEWVHSNPFYIEVIPQQATHF